MEVFRNDWEKTEGFTTKSNRINYWELGNKSSLLDLRPLLLTKQIWRIVKHPTGKHFLNQFACGLQSYSELYETPGTKSIRKRAILLLFSAKSPFICIVLLLKVTYLFLFFSFLFFFLVSMTSRWWECLGLANVAWVRFSNLRSCICWLSFWSHFRGFFSRFIGFFSLWETILYISIRSVFSLDLSDLERTCKLSS